MDYDVIIIGAGPGGIFAANEFLGSGKKVAVFEAGNELSKRKCPIDGEKVKSCIKCKVCSIMSGFGGAGAFSDGKYNITNTSPIIFPEIHLSVILLRGSASLKINSISSIVTPNHAMI